MKLRLLWISLFAFSFSASANPRGKVQETTSRSCFTPAMRVLTPFGYIPLQELKAWDDVISWHTEAHEPVLNRIRIKHEIRRRQYACLQAHNATMQPLELTSSHPVYVPSAKHYEEIGQLSDDTLILHIDGTIDCSSRLVPRGNLAPKGTSKLINLELELPPHNFIVEGILVHSKPIDL